MESCHVKELNGICMQLRKDIIEMLYKAGSGHPGGSLSIVEILTALYFKVMKIDPDNPGLYTRDRFILSKGHAAPGLYAVLSKRGYFPRETLFTLRQIGSILQGHPCMKKTPGVDFSSGSLGQGLSVGCGMALGARLKNIDSQIFVLIGDGELQEGQVWEAAMSAARFGLDNITAIVDYNGVQLDGLTNEIMPVEPLAQRWKASNWNVMDVDGHDVDALVNVFEKAKTCKGAPTVILAKTVKGKGIPFMENMYQWHGKQINTDDYKTACMSLGL